MMRSLRTLLTPSAWPGWVRLLLLNALNVAVLLIVRALTPAGSPWTALAAIVTLSLCVWLGRRLVAFNSRTLLLYSGGYIAVGVMSAYVGAGALSEVTLASGIILLAATILLPLDLSARVRERFGDVDRLRESWRRFEGRAIVPVVRFGAIALALAFAVMLYSPIEKHAMWALTLPGWPQLALIVDALAGAAIVYALLGRFTESRFARACGALAWAASGARLDPALVHVLPTFLLPAYAYCIANLRAGTQRTATLVGFPLVAAVVAPAMLVAFALVAAAALLAREAQPEDRKAVAWSLAAAAAGALASYVVPAIVPQNHVIVSSSLDDRLRDLSADGAWPWEALYPSLAGRFGPIASQLYTLTNRFGNVLLVSTSVGLALLAGTIATWIRLGRLRGVFPAFALVLMALGLFAALPSRLASVPLPTVSEFAAIFAGGAVVAPAAAMCVALSAAILLATVVNVLRVERASLGMAVVVAVLALEMLPNDALFVSAGSLDLTQGVSWASSLGGGTLLASRSDDDPWALYGRFAVSSASAGNVRLAALPDNPALASRARGAGCYLIVNYGAYRGYQAPGLSEFVLVPSDASEGAEQRPSFLIRGLNLERIFGDVAVYDACRAR